ncbi:MAG: exodeoxyribonuclease V subunit gamma [Desulforegulaceae bacterium]|nr:exodeoxyribonuclease V subunit gamma [Desulforegulaceae bacterium]
MKNFNLCFSNKIEVLLERLGKSLEKPEGGVFEPEIIVVQSKGMEKYLSLKLCENLGILSNVLFLYPNSLIEYCLEKTGFLENSSFKPGAEAYTWTIMDLIYQFKDEENFKEVLNYIKTLDGKISIEKLYQFSSKVSRLFMEYQIFRPKWILSWEEDETKAGWQSFLWNRLCKTLGLNYPLKQINNLFEKFDTEKEVLNNLPKKISVFGIFSLPQIYLETLNFFSQNSEINLYLLNPCLDYWGEILPKSTIDNLQKKSKGTELYLEYGNSLLASFGKTGKVFYETINDYPINKIDETYIPPKETSLLSSIQNSILNLFDYSDTSKKNISLNDNSIRIHSCHGPMREMEVLKDNILYILDTDKNIQLSDIIVMIPDIEKYSPYIKSVFGRSNDNYKLTFSIADRSFKSENKGLDSFLKLAGIFTTRFEASVVIDLLEDKFIHQKFGLNEEEVEKIKQWALKLNISWGLDEDFKENFNLSSEISGTWKKGIDLICLGHALNPDDLVFFNNLLPVFELDTSEQETASGLMEFYYKLKKYSKKIIGKKHLAAEWADIFLNICDDFLYFEKTNEFDFINLKKIFTDLKEEAIYSQTSLKIPFIVIYQRIEQIALSASSGYGFLDGRLTFCAMLPMRSIPFKMICVCGLNQGDFPRNYYPPNFDLMGKNRQKGDRHIRDDDRYLFLETIISARNYLYLSYTGKDQETDSIIPPSPILSELIDYIEDNFISPENIIEQITRNHQASSFSSSYFSFDNSGEADLSGSLFSYSKRLMELSKDINLEKPESFVFIDQPLKKDEKSESEFLDLNSFISFFKNPQKFYLKFNSIETEQSFDFFEDREAFNPGNLFEYIISNDLLEMFLTGKDEEISKKIFKSQNKLPYGKTGEVFYNKLKEDIFFFLNKLENYLEKPEKVSLSLISDKLKIKGNLSLYNGKIILFRYGRINPKNLIELWLKHVLALYSEIAQFKNLSIFAGSEKSAFIKSKFENLEKDRVYIEELGKLFEKGCVSPLNFDPDLSFSYVKGIQNSVKKDFSKITDEIREINLSKVKNEISSANSFKDYSLIEKNFRGKDFFDDKFIEISEKFFLPIFKSLNEVN